MKYTHLLKQHKLKATPQRIAIVELMGQSGHIGIEEMYRNIREKFASISLATLYKNIHAMMDTNLIREVKIPGQKSRYEIEKEVHAHLLCRECGDLQDLKYDPKALMDNAVKISSFTAEDISIVISGTCPNCQNKSLLS